jgi:hypothetical protein
MEYDSENEEESEFLEENDDIGQLQIDESVLIGDPVPNLLIICCMMSSPSPLGYSF